MASNIRKGHALIGIGSGTLSGYSFVFIIDITSALPSLIAFSSTAFLI